jgi:hypothetical protein
MNALTITKSDFKKYNLNDLQLKALVMGFAEFNFDEVIKLDMSNVGAQFQKDRIIEDMIDFMTEFEEDHGQVKDKYDSEWLSERLTKELIKKEERRRKWESILDCSTLLIGRAIGLEAENA